VRLCAESSAVLAWLLGEPAGEAIAQDLAAAEEVVVSELTILECHRVLLRAVAAGEITEAEAVDRRAILARVSRHWHRLGIDEEILERAARPFPAEPVRTLDAIHLASALVARSALPEAEVLALDRRVRENALALGLSVRPEVVG
jgi:predicted nucleic acid-binding protein